MSLLPPGLRVAIAGPVRPEAVGWQQVVRTTLAALPEPSEVRTGAAHGIDSLAAQVARELWPAARHALCIPAGCWFNEECLEWDGYDNEVIAGGYMARNDALILGADALIAFPSYPGEVRRSGTWATIRRARRRALPIQIVPLAHPGRQSTEGPSALPRTP